MQSKEQKKFRFSLLEKVPMDVAMKISMNDNIKTDFYQKHKKELHQTIYLIQISHLNEQWILLKTGKQCYHLLNEIYRPHQQKNQFRDNFSTAMRQFFNSIWSLTLKNQFLDANLINYLNDIGQKNNILENTVFTDFIEYDNTFERYVYRKFIMIKKNGGRYKEGCCSMGKLWTQWKKRQVSIQYNGITYKNQSGQIKQYLPFSHGFQYFFGKAQTGLNLGIILVSNHRRLFLQTQNIQDYIMFLYLIKKKTIESPYFNINRFNSFAPPRELINSEFYIDGKEYFDALASSIQKAKRSIYMTGWMISPQFLLKRSPKNVSLFDIVKERAEEGLQINILVYHESSFLPNDSAWVKQKFQSLSHKVKVIRHPTGKLPILWSHHSKMVIIDKEEAFFGGLDLCYGRYDCNKHEIFPENMAQIYPGIEYNNCRIKDIDNVRKFTVDHIDKRNPRLPWHDICQSVKGDIVSDFAHHFVEIWNFASYENREVLNTEIINNPTEFQIKTIHNLMSTKDSDNQVKSQKQDGKIKNNKFFAAISGKFEEVKMISKERIAVIKKKLYPQKRKLEQLYRKKKIYAASKNFQNYIAEIHRELSQIHKDQNEQQCKQNIRPSIQVKSVKNQPHKKQIKFQKRASLLVPNQSQKEEVNTNENFMIHLKKLELKQEEIVPEVDEDIDSEEEGPGKIWQNKPFLSDEEKGPHQCQLLRSVGNWSIGCSAEKTEFSIHIAYLQLISQAKNYIYIENQFFISSTPETKDVKNEVVNALFRRIKTAIQNQQNFKVYVMLPLLPAFAGDLEANDCTFLRMIMEWQYRTIRSLVQRIEDLGVSSQKYIQFFGLRTHGVNSQNQPSTEIIYVHSKLMIVDDTCTIIGSANINDRSMLGDRDSQIAVVTYGSDLVQKKMGGKATFVSQKIKEFRTRLWKEHFDLSQVELQDPNDDNLWTKVHTSSENNSEIYRRVFGCYPDNKMRRLKNLKQIKEQAEAEKYPELIKKIRGNATQYPYNFLVDEPIASSVVSKEYFIPKQCLI